MKTILKTNTVLPVGKSEHFNVMVFDHSNMSQGNLRMSATNPLGFRYKGDTVLKLKLSTIRL